MTHGAPEGEEQRQGSERLDLERRGATQILGDAQGQLVGRRPRGQFRAGQGDAQGQDVSHRRACRGAGDLHTGGAIVGIPQTRRASAGSVAATTSAAWTFTAAPVSANAGPVASLSTVAPLEH